MKKFIAVMALAIVPFMFFSCAQKSTEDVVYEMGLALSGNNSAMGNPNSEAAKVCKEIEASLGAFVTETWVETVEGGDLSAADEKAVAKYETKLQQLKAVETEANQKIQALTDKGYSFEIGNVLYLKRIRSGENKMVREYHLALSY